jgi:hypothetical protein
MVTLGQLNLPDRQPTNIERSGWDTAQVLLDAAGGADLVVVGSRGHGRFTGALTRSVSQHRTHQCGLASRGLLLA